MRSFFSFSFNLNNWYEGNEPPGGTFLRYKKAGVHPTGLTKKGVKALTITPQNNTSYLSDTADAALPRLGVCWSVIDWFDSFRVLLLRSGLESVCDRSLSDPWDPEACKEFWEPNLPLRTGMDGTVKPLWSAVFDWSAPLWLTNILTQVNGRCNVSRASAKFCFVFNSPESAVDIGEVAWEQDLGPFLENPKNLSRPQSDF